MRALFHPYPSASFHHRSERQDKLWQVDMVTDRLVLTNLSTIPMVKVHAYSPRQEIYSFM